MKLTLELMLFGLAAILRRNSNKPLVQAKLREQTRSVQIRTLDASVARYFVFCGGAVLSRRGVLANPDVSLLWKDAGKAARVMRSSAPDALPDALADGWLRITGDSEVAGWFGELVRLARGAVRSEVAAKPPVAVIGLGRMGSGIAGSLLGNGYPLTVFNRSEEKLRPLVEAGAKAAPTPAAAARAAGYVITSMANDAAMRAVAEGPDGLIAGLGRGAIHIGA